MPKVIRLPSIVVLQKTHCGNTNELEHLLNKEGKEREQIYWSKAHKKANNIYLDQKDSYFWQPVVG